jgi:hypothetical protein
MSSCSVNGKCEFTFSSQNDSQNDKQCGVCKQTKQCQYIYDVMIYIIDKKIKDEYNLCEDCHNDFKISTLQEKFY